MNDFSRLDIHTCYYTFSDIPSCDLSERLYHILEQSIIMKVTVSASRFFKNSLHTCSVLTAHIPVMLFVAVYILGVTYRRGSTS